MPANLPPKTASPKKNLAPVSNSPAQTTVNLSTTSSGKTALLS
ncbi:hypothetical protein CRYPD_578 [uncultured Candidatus Thioglobus sp.]|nr:hypothetical protein CRYPD_578 [uncultured Candidatus Thioglobus sp.]